MTEFQGQGPRVKTIKKNTNSTQNKSQIHRAKQYEVTSLGPNIHMPATGPTFRAG